jgi:hypothetical protein
MGNKMAPSNIPNACGNGKLITPQTTRGVDLWGFSSVKNDIFDTYSESVRLES